MLKALMERRAAQKRALEELHQNAVAENGEARSLTDAETATFDEGVAELRRLDERIAELQAAEVREAAAAAHRVEIGEAGTEVRSDTQVVDPPVYAKGNIRKSFYRDMAKARLSGDRDAAESLQRHARQVAGEQRALGNTNTTGGSGGRVIFAAA